MLAQFPVSVGEQRKPADGQAGDQYQEEGGKYALDAPGVELAKAKGVSVQVLENDGRDQVTRNDEEDVHADKPPLHQGGKGMETHNGKHRDGAQSIDIGTVLWVGKVRCGSVSNHTRNPGNASRAHQGRPAQRGSFSEGWCLRGVWASYASVSTALRLLPGGILPLLLVASDPARPRAGSRPVAEAAADAVTPSARLQDAVPARSGAACGCVGPTTRGGVRLWRGRRRRTWRTARRLRIRRRSGRFGAVASLPGLSARGSSPGAWFNRDRRHRAAAPC